MSHGHHAHKGFSQTSKKYDGGLKEQHQRSRATQHSTETARDSMDDKAPKQESGRGAKITQST